MFDFRYHALSLVAVFLALSIGLLLGVAIGDEGLVSSAENRVRDSLRGDVDKARAESRDLRREIAERKQLEDDLYPLLVEGRLSGYRIALVGLGGLPDTTIRAVRESLRETGGRLQAVAVVREPPPEDLAGGPTTDAALAQRSGLQAGQLLLRPGAASRPLRRKVLDSSSGSLDGVNAVILVRSAPDTSAPEAKVTEAFEVGLVDGLVDSNATVVGVEETGTKPSQIGWYKDRRLASVDNVDQLPGRAALVLGLGGASGAFGVKDTAQALLPKTAGAAATR
ncbi:MAG: copper transporter [Solirubrobacteraceae bacterium]